MGTTPHTQAIDTINNFSAYRLSLKAGVESPDALDSHGAQFLTSVRDALVEWVDYNLDETIETLSEKAQDDAFEQVDATVPAYTHQLWQTFTDLAAYDDESAGEFAGGTMTETVSYILVRIAERLFVALAEEYVAAYGNGEDDDEDYDDEYVSVCPACGEFIDYCHGHGVIGDPDGAAILEAHDDGNHEGCHPTAIYNGECN